jgi:hypothetical protein
MSLNQFLQLLENRVDHNAVAAIWHDVMQEAALKHFLQPTKDMATAYPDSKTGQMMNIVKHPDGSIVAVDEENPNIRKPLMQADVVLYSPDWQNLRKQLASVLSLTTSRMPIPDRVGIFQLGHWEPKKTALFPVYMVVCKSSSDLHKTTLQLVNQYKKDGILLLTPTNRHWNENITQMVRSHKMLLVAMDEILEIQDGQLKSTEEWNGYLNGFCQMIEMKLPGNYQNKKSRPKRAVRTAKIESIRRALVDHIKAARDYAFTAKQYGKDPLMPRPNKTKLAEMAGVESHDITRCFKDDPQLVRLYNMADSLDDIMTFGK